MVAIKSYRNKVNFFKRTVTIALVITLLALFQNRVAGQNYKCNINNNAFSPGESLTYLVAYDIFIFWTNVGIVNFSVAHENKKDKRNLYLHGTGRTLPGWNWFFRVEDSYESWTDPVSLIPYEFKRDVYEGGYEIDIHYNFDRDNNIAYSVSKKTNKEQRKDTIRINECTYDVLSILYYTRNLDYSNYSVNDTIPVNILLDNELTNIYFRYLGKEIINVHGFGKFRCIKFSVYLVEGTLFKGGEDMEVWVTDDKNKIPLKIKSPILIGSVKARIIDISDIKHPLSSKIEKFK